MLTRDAILQAIRNHWDFFQARGVKKIGLFGSYARDQAQTGSDIDLLVEFDPGEKTFSHFMDIKIFLEDLFERKIDLVTPNALRPTMSKNVLEDVMYAEISN